MKHNHAPSGVEIDHFSPQRTREQVDRIIRSKVFRNAPALQRLLQYVTTKAAEGLGDQLKEYTIGVDVYERGPNYDPKIDTVVRVEVHRLRQRLREYYEREGADDPVFIEIPKGHYVPSFEARSSLARVVDQAAPSAISSPLATPHSELEEKGKKPGEALHRSPLFALPMIMAALAIALFFAGLTIGARWTRTQITKMSAMSSLPAGSAAADPDDAVRNFWAGFMGKNTRLIVGYANAVFLVDETNDLFRFRRGPSDHRGAPVDPHLARQFASNPALVARAGPLFYEYGYSGTGDVQSIFTLTNCFTHWGYEITVKRSRLVTINDLQEHNVILLGSSFQNEAVEQLPSAGDFVYKSSPLSHELWKGQIINLHPLAGEAASYMTERDAITQVVKADYALVTVQPGIRPGQYIATFGGLDTSGVVGATDFATSKSGVEELARHLQAVGQSASANRPPPFQALLKVDVENGLDVMDVHLVAVHAMRAKNEATDLLRAAGPSDKSR
jgi:hypothetical protein